MKYYCCTLRCHQTRRAGKRTIKISDFPMNTSNYKGCSIAMFNYQWVLASGSEGAVNRAMGVQIFFSDWGSWGADQHVFVQCIRGLVDESTRREFASTLQKFFT